jgi:arsenate reductase
MTEAATKSGGVPNGHRRVLVLCTHNSARSQMAEGFLRAMGGGRLDVESAGTEATRVHPLAIRVMDEVGIDLRAHTSKTLDRFPGRDVGLRDHGVRPRQ